MIDCVDGMETNDGEGFKLVGSREACMTWMRVRKINGEQFTRRSMGLGTGYSMDMGPGSKAVGL